MADFYMNITSQNESYDYGNISYNYNDSSNIINNNYHNPNIIILVVTCIVISISLPLTLVAIYALCSQIRKDHVAPIYVINLLISDLIQFCCMIVQVAATASDVIGRIWDTIYLSALMASVCFMVCIALERYLVIVHPLWYRFRRNIKTSVVVCVLVWVFTFVYVLVYVFCYNDILLYICGVFFFLPLPLFIFFLGGTLKALSASRVPSDEKRRIVGILVLVLLIYMLLFLPTIILVLSRGDLDHNTFNTLSDIFLWLSPLADSTLYIFMRKGTIDKLLSSVCCCRMDSDDTNSSVQFSSVQSSSV